MPPKDTATNAAKRKSTAKDSSAPKKAAVDKATTKNAEASSTEQMTDDEEEKQRPSLAGLPRELLDRIFSGLAPPDRYNLRLACSRLYEVEQRAPGQRRVACAHLAIWYTVELASDGGGVRASRRLRGADTLVSKCFLECVVHDAVHCLAHGTHEPTAKCSLVQRGARGSASTRGDDPFAPKLAADAVHYWKIAVEEAPAFLLSISKTIKVDATCITADLSDCSQDATALEQLRGFLCPSVALTHGKPMSTIERAARVEIVEQAAALPRRIYCDLPYFQHAKKLLLRNVSLEEGQHNELYTALKGSSLSHLALIYDQAKVANAQVQDLVEEIVPWAVQGRSSKAPAVWGDFFERGVRDRRWLLRTEGKNWLGRKRRVVIERV